jgi:hypothetical protein
MKKLLNAPLSSAAVQDLAELCADEQVQCRYEDLAGKNTDGTLTRAELDELTVLVNANQAIGLAKAGGSQPSPVSSE